jgi:diguanylate cyclase (GGDEF)-like protein/PAS domain S-box-containing protein
MKMPRLHPSIRISIGLIALTISILLVGELLGFVPDKSQVTLDARKKLSETLAVQFALAAEREDITQIETGLNQFVKRNPEVLSAAIRNSDGSFYAVTRNHESVWQNPSNGGSASSNIQIPIMQGNQLWGTVELGYASVFEQDFWSRLKNSFWGMVLFVAIVGFFGYLIFLKRALKDLDPSKVIPMRVRAAFDTLTEGILILDEQGQIVLANHAFCNNIGLDFECLIGQEAASLKWKRISVNQFKEDWIYPWSETLQSGEIQTDVRLSFDNGNEKGNIFTVNCSPILSDGNQCRGALVSFYDVTELEDKNSKLQTMLKNLEASKNEIFRQNDELKILAEIDPLTGCYNRRAFQAHFDEIFAIACDQDANLNCIMLDIDHFKSVNDNYGHQTGDEVIKLVANIIRDSLRDTDIVGRYGGEEFCLVLPNLDHEATLRIAERIRLSVMNSSEYRLIGIEGVTISLGISSVKDDVNNSTELIDLADKALYYAKNNGRNRIIVWRDGLEEAGGIAAIDNGGNDCNDITRSDENDSLNTDVKLLYEKIKELEELNAEQKEVFQRKLNFDSITGLPNRVLLNDRLNNAVNHALRTKGSVAVLSLSFDAYKRIQGTLGYKAAEKLIVELSNILSGVLRVTDTVSSDIGAGLFDSVLSRKNDDSFYVLIPDLKREQSITWIINRIFAAFSSPVVVAEFNVKVDSAIGVSMYPIDGREPDGLLKSADLARNYAESQGKNNCQFYSDKMNNLFATQLKIESELARAVECDELEVYYQPIVDVQDGRISKLEALLRWNHPEKNILSAVSFIEVAEENGQIISIGDWVLREVIQQLAVWRREISQDIVVSVNVSALQLRHDEIGDNILSYLRENDVPTKNLILEITESAVVQDLGRATQIMAKLHDQGVQIALDDFGTGYSSLQYIHQFPIDIIKIDRSFVNNIESNGNDASIISMVIDIAEKLGFTTVAEGVETEAQFNRLCDLRCNEIQGYLVSRPIPKKQIQEMLEQQESDANKSKVRLAV